jgi:hypothetical protein
MDRPSLRARRVDGRIGCKLGRVDVFLLLEKGLIALRPTIVELERRQVDVHTYVLALFDGTTHAGAAVAAAVLERQLGLDGAAAALAASGVANTSRSQKETFVVAVVIDEATLLATLASVVAPRAIEALTGWFARTPPARCRVVAVTGEVIYGVLLDDARMALAGYETAPKPAVLH